MIQRSRQRSNSEDTETAVVGDATYLVVGLGNDPTARILKQAVDIMSEFGVLGLGNDPTARILKLVSVNALD